MHPLDLTPLPEQPRVSVAIAAFNYGRFLVECLESCLAQTLPPDEIIVVDDGSNDETALVLEDYRKRNPHIKVITQENSGIAAATNVALGHCSGDVVFMLDADDAMLPERCETVVRALRTSVDGHFPGWVHHSLIKFNTTSEYLGMGPNYSEAPSGWLALETVTRGVSPVQTETSAMAFRREVLIAIGSIDSHRFMAQDNQLQLAASVVSPVIWIPRALTRYRVHAASDSYGGMYAQPHKLRLYRARREKTYEWFREWLCNRSPAAVGMLPPLTSQHEYVWETYLDTWWSTGVRNISLWREAVSLADLRGASFQKKMYLYSGRWLPRNLFLAFSGLLFGGGWLKFMARRLIFRRA